MVTSVKHLWKRTDINNDKIFKNIDVEKEKQLRQNVTFFAF